MSFADRTKSINVGYAAVVFIFGFLALIFIAGYVVGNAHGSRRSADRIAEQLKDRATTGEPFRVKDGTLIQVIPFGNALLKARISSEEKK